MTDDIRDPDLLARLEKARGSFVFDVERSHLRHLQEERDQERAKSTARAAELAAMPRDIRRRSIVREVIENEGPSPENLRFMPTPLAICGMPYRRLAHNELEYERTQGRMGVVVTAGKLRAPDGTRVQQPVPWGPKARLILSHMSTVALRNNSPVVDTAETLSAFMRDMGFEARGGRNGNINPFKEQLRALAACRMEISSWDGHRSAQVDVKPLDKVEIWFGDNPEQQSLWPTQIAFSTSFYEQLKKHALPIDIRALRALSNSARKLDLLFWITYRITRLNETLVVGWKPLKEQFGEGFTRDRKFRETFVDDLASIRELYPKLPIKLTERGLEMEAADKSVLSIPRRLIS
ncbi:replication protein RepA [Mesorhizobium sp. M0276]|uniref:replication protein RepA n=1 Tax=Mesorhizobium sp. M0276 TaxID=2956928 RepID=UPI00333923CB